MTRTLTRLTPLALAIGMLAAPYAHAQQDPPAGNEAMAELAALEQNSPCARERRRPLSPAL